MIKKSLKLLSILVMVLVIGGAATMSAQAQGVTLDFFVAGGELSFSSAFEPDSPAPAGTIITGKNIPVLGLWGPIAPFNDGIDNGLFLIGEFSQTTTFLSFKATVGGGGEIHITSSTGFTMDGTLSSTKDGVLDTLDHSLTAVFTEDEKNDNDSGIFDHFGLDPSYPSTDWFGNMNLTYRPGLLTVLSGNIVNNNNAPPPGAPIPGSLVLLGSGLITMLGIGIRRKSD